MHLSYFGRVAYLTSWIDCLFTDTLRKDPKARGSSDTPREGQIAMVVQQDGKYIPILAYPLIGRSVKLRQRETRNIRLFVLGLFVFLYPRCKEQGLG